MQAPQPTDAERAEARRHPGGYLYRVAVSCGQTEHVPPEAILGAWAVNQQGEIHGGWIPNAKYDPHRWPS